MSRFYVMKKVNNSEYHHIKSTIGLLLILHTSISGFITIINKYLLVFKLYKYNSRAAHWVFHKYGYLEEDFKCRHVTCWIFFAII